MLLPSFSCSNVPTCVLNVEVKCSLYLLFIIYRLYNQLEEVQKCKITQQRQKDYAVNRQRRKDFEQKLQSRLNKLTKITKPSS